MREKKYPFEGCGFAVAYIFVRYSIVLHDNYKNFIPHYTYWWTFGAKTLINSQQLYSPHYDQLAYEMQVLHFNNI